MLSAVSSCACKGIRTCKLCKPELFSESVSSKKLKLNTNNDSRGPPDDKSRHCRIFTYCLNCRSCVADVCECMTKSESRASFAAQFPEPSLTSISGVDVFRDFVSPEEETFLCENIDAQPWVVSQSGRRKQDFGPKVNFKKKKVKLDSFAGLPRWMEDTYKRIQGIESLSDFSIVEQCNLEYTPERGASIDPHFDDFWLWGERLVTLNLLSDTVYSMHLPGDPSLEILVPVPQRSLIVLSGEARHKFTHAIASEFITQRRIGITLRELSARFITSGTQEELDIGQRFFQIAESRV